jgi:hypothetical protein
VKVPVLAGGKGDGYGRSSPGLTGSPLATVNGARKGARSAATPLAMAGWLPVLATWLDQAPAAEQFLAHGDSRHFHARYLGHASWRGGMIGAMGPVVGSDAIASGVAGPGARGIVSRPRLFERLAAPARVMVVSAPPGRGKTVLVRYWISQARLAERAAWVPSGRGERDPQRFWLSVLGALR